MKIYYALIICLSASIFSSCGNMKPEQKSTAPSPKRTIQIDVATLATKTDPVCGMALKQGEVGDTASYNGKIYGFCGTGCKDDFMKSPTQYVTQ